MTYRNSSTRIEPFAAKIPVYDIEPSYSFPTRYTFPFNLCSVNRMKLMESAEKVFNWGISPKDRSPNDLEVCFDILDGIDGVTAWLLIRDGITNTVRYSKILGKNTHRNSPHLDQEDRPFKVDLGFYYSEGISYVFLNGIEGTINDLSVEGVPTIEHDPIKKTFSVYNTPIDEVNQLIDAR